MDHRRCHQCQWRWNQDRMSSAIRIFWCLTCRSTGKILANTCMWTSRVLYEYHFPSRSGVLHGEKLVSSITAWVEDMTVTLCVIVVVPYAGDLCFIEVIPQYQFCKPERVNGPTILFEYRPWEVEREAYDLKAASKSFSLRQPMETYTRLNIVRRRSSIMRIYP